MSARTPLQIALRKRADAVRSIEVRKRSIAALEARITALDREIVQMGGPPKPRRQVIPFRANGEMQRALYDLLRMKGEATAADLAAVMLAHYGLDASDPATAYAMRQRCIQAFQRCERRGFVKRVGARGRFNLWALCQGSTVKTRA